MPHCNTLLPNGAPCRLRVAADDHRCELHINLHPAAAAQFDLPTPEATVRRLRALHNNLYNIANARAFLRRGYLAPTLHALQTNPDVNVRFHAAWVLTNLSSIEDFDNGGIAIVDAGGIPVLLRHALPPTEPGVDNELTELSTQAIWCLGNLAGCGAVVRREVCDAVLGYEWPIERFDTTYLRHFAFLFQNITQSTLATNAAQLEGLGARMLLRMVDVAVTPVVFRDMLHGFLRIHQRSEVASPTTIRCVLDLLDHTSGSVRGLALRYIGDVVSGHNAVAIDACLSEGITLIFQRMLQEPRQSVTHSIFWCLSNLAVEPLGAMMIVETPGLLTKIVECCAVQPEAVWTASNLAHRSSADIFERLNAERAHVALYEAMRTMENPTVASEGVAAMLIHDETGRVRSDLGLPETFQIVVTADEPTGSISETATRLRERG